MRAGEDAQALPRPDDGALPTPVVGARSAVFAQFLSVMIQPLVQSVSPMAPR